MDGIALHILTGDGPVLERQVEYVNLPTSFGSLGILKGHAPLLCNLEEGTLRCRWNGGSARVLIGAGLASVEHNELNVLASGARILEEVSD